VTRHHSAGKNHNIMVANNSLENVEELKH